MIVFADDVTNKISLNAREIQATIEAARMYGCRVVIVPTDFASVGGAENTLAYTPSFDEPELAVWTGFVPMYERYTALYDAAQSKNIRLVNTPQQHATVMAFEKFYPLIKHITPKSVIISDMNQLDTITEQLAFPIFVKGSVKSKKLDGVDSVVARDKSELQVLVEAQFSDEYKSRGIVIAREFVPLIKVAKDEQGFPISREYRVFVYQGNILDHSFYWDEYQDTGISDKDVEKVIRQMTAKVVEMVSVPFFTLDIAQAQSGEWIVIELGDGQFSGLSQIPVLRLWSKISQWKMPEG
ncbi:MAG: ATP-grasp domain-containing protein [Chloroflexota bacterium]